MKVNGDNQLAMYQTYAVINSVSPVVGSTLGKQLVTIVGEYFTPTQLDVRIGGKTVTLFHQKINRLSLSYIMTDFRSGVCSLPM